MMLYKHQEDNDVTFDKEERGLDELASAANVEKQFCTRAVTGSTPFFQAIYVCQTCCIGTNGTSQADALPLCICSACVIECHSDHDIEYVGMGPSFCDCQDMKCCILNISIDEALKLGFEAAINQSSFKPPVSVNKLTDLYIRDIYHIPKLQDRAFREYLVCQARELVRHTKDTFWLDAKILNHSKQLDSQNLCEIEHFAWNIFSRHVENYSANNEGDEKERIMGAEWWVQVKPTCSESAQEAQQATPYVENITRDIEGIDLHYDKDEEMAAKFAIGVFPYVSTVTYLTIHENVPPTIIFPRRYDELDDDENEGSIADMFISHPRLSKHVAFDGRLLHGAPSHDLLRNKLTCATINGKNEDSDMQPEQKGPKLRITLLVNIWIGHKPLGVNALPEHIRSVVVRNTAVHVDGKKFADDNNLKLIPTAPVHQVHLHNTDDLPEFLCKRIELPFVGGKATWGTEPRNEGDIEVENKITVSTFPPPAHPNHDSILVRFGPGLEARFNYTNEIDD